MNETLNGLNGKQLESKIFIGPTYYQRLKHWLKIRSVAFNGTNGATRQPRKGAEMVVFVSVDGTDCTCVRGLKFLKERVMFR